MRELTNLEEYNRNLASGCHACARFVRYLLLSMAEGLPTSLLLSGFYVQQFNYQAPLLRIVTVICLFLNNNVRDFNGNGFKR